MSVDFGDLVVTGPITRPNYVMRIRLGQATVLMSTGPAADSEIGHFVAGKIAEDSFTVDDLAMRIALVNEDYSMTAAALNGDYYGGRCEVWSGAINMAFEEVATPYDYIEEGYEEGDERTVVAEKVFDGEISEIPEISEKISMIASREKLGGFPRVRVMAPLVNHTAQHGTKITFNNHIYIVEKR